MSATQDLWWDTLQVKQQPFKLPVKGPWSSGSSFGEVSCHATLTYTTHPGHGVATEGGGDGGWVCVFVGGGVGVSNDNILICIA